MQEVKPARDKGNARAWCRPRGCRSRLPPASCACKTPTGKPTITEGEILWGSRNEGRSVAAAWNVHGEISRTGEVLEEKLSGPLVPQQSSCEADKGLGLKCTRNFQRCLLQTPLCSLPRHPPPSQAVAGCINTCKKLLVGKKSASAEPRRTTPAVHQLLLLTISPLVRRAKGAQSRATAGIDQKRRQNRLQRLFWVKTRGFTARCGAWLGLPPRCSFTRCSGGGREQPWHRVHSFSPQAQFGSISGEKPSRPRRQGIFNSAEQLS